MVNELRLKVTTRYGKREATEAKIIEDSWDAFSLNGLDSSQIWNRVAADHSWLVVTIFGCSHTHPPPPPSQTVETKKERDSFRFHHNPVLTFLLLRLLIHSW